MPCPYAHALGIPGEGVHAPRLLGLARFDTIATLLVAFITSFIIQFKYMDILNTLSNSLFSMIFIYCFVAWFVLGEILHYLFGTNTAFLKMIGLSPKC